MDFKEVVMVNTCRTAIGDFLGSLGNVSARHLAVTAGEEAIKKAKIPADIIDEICLG